VTDQEPSAPDHQGDQTEAQAHPERAVDELEKRILGRQIDQDRNEDDTTESAGTQAGDEPGPGTEPPGSRRPPPAVPDRRRAPVNQSQNRSLKPCQPSELALLLLRRRRNRRCPQACRRRTAPRRHELVPDAGHCLDHARARCRAGLLPPHEYLNSPDVTDVVVIPRHPQQLATMNTRPACQARCLSSSNSVYVSVEMRPCSRIDYVASSITSSPRTSDSPLEGRRADRHATGTAPRQLSTVCAVVVNGPSGIPPSSRGQAVRQAHTASPPEWAHIGAPVSSISRRRASASMPKWACAMAWLWSASAGSGSAR
jgi:hypothetical protein